MGKLQAIDELIPPSGAPGTGIVSIDKGGRHLDIRTAIEEEHGSAAFEDPGFDVTDGVRLAFSRAVSLGVPLYIPINPADPSGLWRFRGVEVESGRIEIFGEGGLIAHPSITANELVILGGNDNVLRGVTFSMDRDNLDPGYSGRGSVLQIWGADSFIEGVTCKHSVVNGSGSNFEIHAPDCTLRGVVSDGSGWRGIWVRGGDGETVIERATVLNFNAKGITCGQNNRKLVVRNSYLHTISEEAASDAILGETGAGYVLNHLVLEDILIEGIVQSNRIKTVNAENVTMRRVKAHCHETEGGATAFRSQHQYLSDPVSEGVRTKILIEECDFVGQVGFEGRERIVNIKSSSIKSRPGGPCINMLGRRLVIEDSYLESEWRGITASPSYPSRDGEDADLQDIELNRVEWRGTGTNTPLEVEFGTVNWKVRDLRVISGISNLVDEAYRPDSVVRLTDLARKANRYNGSDHTHIPGVHVGTSGDASTTPNVALGSIGRESGYLEFHSSRNMGVFVDTRTHKRFAVRRDHYGASTSHVWVVCYDADDNILSGDDPLYVANHRQRGVAWNTSTGMGGGYRTSSLTAQDAYFDVHPDVQYIRISVGSGDLNGFSIDALVRDNEPSARGAVDYWLGYDVPVEGVGVATTAPPTDEHADGVIIYNATPTVSGTGGSQYVIEGWQKIAGAWVPRRYLTGT